MMGYRYLIFDVDGTLLNFGHAYSCAQKAVAEKLGVAYTPEYVALDEKLSWKGWRESGLVDTGMDGAGYAGSLPAAGRGA